MTRSPTVDERDECRGQAQERKQHVACSVQLKGPEHGGHAPRAAPDELYAEEEAGVTERDHDEVDRHPVASESEQADDHDDDQQRGVRKCSAVRQPEVAEEAIPDEQSARDSEREDIRQIAEAEAPEPLRTLAADHGEYL